MVFITIEELLTALKAFPSYPIIPNSAQREVMLHEGGPLRVIAGPGTGKTQVLILRCLYLLCVKKIPPGSILLTTYTRKAAQQLRQRLQEALQQILAFSPEVKQIDLTAMRNGTIHRVKIQRNFYTCILPPSEKAHPLLTLYQRTTHAYISQRKEAIDQGKVCYSPISASMY